MTSRISTILVLSPLLLLAAPAKQAAAQCASPGIEGLWRGNDGGTYRIYWSGSQIQWDGRSGDNGRSWVNRLVGTYQGHILKGAWWDLGRQRGRGTLTIKMVNDHLLVRTASTGSGFGGTRWTRPAAPRGCNDTVLIPAED